MSLDLILKSDSGREVVKRGVTVTYMSSGGRVSDCGQVGGGSDSGHHTSARTSVT